MKKNGKKLNKARSTILFQIAALAVAVFVISSIVSYLFYMRSTNALTKNSEEKVIETRAEDMASSFTFITNLLTEVTEKQTGNIELDEFLEAINGEEVLPVQQMINEQMCQMVLDGTLGMDVCAVAIPEIPPMIEEPLIIMTSNEELMYTNVPESISKHLDGDGGYALLDNGVPEWNLEGDQLLVCILQRAEDLGGYGFWAVLLKPMKEDIAAVGNYFENEKKNIDILMTVVIVSTILALVVVLFLALSFLIRKKITRPIDELADAAEQVMDGDLDVEVPVRKGEEFEGLKRTFNEMLISIRKLMGWKSDMGDK